MNHKQLLKVRQILEKESARANRAEAELVKAHDLYERELKKKDSESVLISKETSRVKDQLSKAESIISDLRRQLIDQKSMNQSIELAHAQHSLPKVQKELADMQLAHDKLAEENKRLRLTISHSTKHTSSTHDEFAMKVIQLSKDLDLQVGKTSFLQKELDYERAQRKRLEDTITELQTQKA
ncbi:hypothetical protein ADUPG1_010541, partial [Aduncisulcus paluster]